MRSDMNAEGLWPRCASRVDNVGLAPGTGKWEVEKSRRIMLNYAVLLHDTQVITHSLISLCIHGGLARTMPCLVDVLLHCVALHRDSRYIYISISACVCAVMFMVLY